jgi:predicted chitinase
MWWIIVDGRQKGRSEGVNLYELAELGRSFGCHEVLNLDGGGSTTLVVQHPMKAGHQVVNTPIGLLFPGTLRWNGNNLGLYVFTEDRAVTSAQLKAIMPTLTAERLLAFVGPLNRTMWKHAITTPKRRAAFLAQLAHESDELRFMEELASGLAYEGRNDLGNTEPGDGKRFKGRGPIQLTGRANYRKAGEALGLKLEQNPEMAARPEIGCQIAGWFWQTRKLNALADDGDFAQITRRINGGLNGQKQRDTYYQKALSVLKVSTK